jgi:cytochrome c556
VSVSNCRLIRNQGELMLRTVVVVGTLLLGIGVVAAQQDALKNAQATMKGNGKALGGVLGPINKGEKPCDYSPSPKIWEDKAGFDAAIATFAKAVTDAKASVKDLDTLKAAFPAIGKSCGGCHETYRVKNS